MRRFTDAGRQAVAKENWYSALTLGLVIPEICASLEQPGPGKSQKRYEAWARKWLEPDFTRKIGYPAKEHVFLSAEDIFQARCSIIHSGTAEIDGKRRAHLDRFEFFTDGPHMNWVSGTTINGVAQPNYLQLRVDMLCETIFRAAERWDESVLNDAVIQAEKAKLLVIHSPGTAIGGIRWG